MGISSGDAVVLAQVALSAQRLKVSRVENSNGLQIIRIAGPNGATISSITITPALRELNEAEATAAINTLVLDACRAAAGEPANRKTADQITKEEGQKSEAKPQALTSPAPISIPGIPIEPIGGQLE